MSGVRKKYYRIVLLLILLLAIGGGIFCIYRMYQPQDSTQEGTLVQNDTDRGRIVARIERMERTYVC